jgi:aspartate/methionine/tyrosine aminotransferase
MEIVARASELAGQGKDIISMCLGQPAAPAPVAARDAAASAIAVGKIGYTPAPGTKALRNRISRYYGDHYGLDCDPARIFITTGSSAGFMLAFLAGFNPGDRIVIPSPGYPAYRNILRALSLEPVDIMTLAEDRWVMTSEQLMAIHERDPVQGILVANPNNPNGTMMQPPAFRGLIDTCRSASIRFISDEIYHGLTYGTPEITALEFDRQAFVINSFSKFFCMTGWRIGWMIVPENMLTVVDRLQQNLFICAPEISQIAALAAFDGIDEMIAIKRGYERNREMFLHLLPQLGFRTIQPVDGAFYAYCDASALTNDSADFASRLLEDTGVAITPGMDFDTRRGDAWLRFSFCGDHDRLAEGFIRIEEWLPKAAR